jgi:hypothetical protein
MHLIFKHLNQDKIDICCEEFWRNKSLCKTKYFKQKYKGNIREFKNGDIDHTSLVKFENTMEAILSKNIIDFIISKFGQMYLINKFEATVNGFNPGTHKDGQGMGYSKQSLLDQENIFKVVHYFKLEENEPVMRFGVFNSNAFKKFSNEFLFKTTNFILDKCIKSKFLKPIFVKNNEALIFSSNVWHKPTVPKKIALYDQNRINKIYVAYEFATNEQSARNFIRKVPKNFGIKTSLNDFLPNLQSRLENEIRDNKNFKIINCDKPDPDYFSSNENFFQDKNKF